jgi:hypothetical protein
VSVAVGGGASGEKVMNTEITDVLKRLVGQHLLKSRNFCATRYFYFGDRSAVPEGDERVYSLGLECPWRVQTSGRILVGSEDYYERAESNTDPSWEPGEPGGDLQSEKLAELLGELKDGDVVTTKPGFTVDSAEVDAHGGVLLRFVGNLSLCAFPCSVGEMEWHLILPERGSIMLIKGEVIRVAHNESRGRQSPGRNPVKPR